jgi:uncharacterized membrane protein HdeD (DUF308 family)
MINHNTAHGAHPAAMQQLKKNANWFLLLGIGLIVLGMLAVFFTFTSTLFSIVYLGAFLIVLGAFEAIKSFKINLWSNFFLHIFLAILYIAAGIFILAYPVINAVTLTLLLAIFFVISGIAKIIMAWSPQAVHKGWLAFNGAVTLLLGILIWQQWPLSGLWVIGMLVGIDAIFTGWTWVMLALAVKRLTHTPQ